MKIALSLITAAVLAGFSGAAGAANYTLGFAGTVASTQGATGHSVGDAVTGALTIVNSGPITSFSAAGKSATGAYTSSESVTPGGTDAIYSAQISPVAQGGTSNMSFTLDLSSLTSFPSTDTALTLLQDTAQLLTNLDTINNPLSAFPSTFGYYTAQSNGTNVVSLFANLTSLSVSVPEPATMALLTVSLLGAAAFRRRRG